jgi:hypothetical protein
VVNFKKGDYGFPCRHHARLEGRDGEAQMLFVTPTKK